MTSVTKPSKASQEREERAAAALRENLRRRKDQQRARDQEKTAPEKEGKPSCP